MKTVISLWRKIVLALGLTFFGAAPLAAQHDELITAYFYGVADTTFTDGVPDNGWLKFTVVESRTNSNPSVFPRTRDSQATMANFITTPLTDFRVEVGRTY